MAQQALPKTYSSITHLYIYIYTLKNQGYTSTKAHLIIQPIMSDVYLHL